MKLRTRLFLGVGLLFLLVFGVSLFLETTLTDKNLKKAETQFREKLLSQNEQKRKAIEHYLYVGLKKDASQIDALFLRLSRNPLIGSTFFLTPSSLSLTAPAHSAFLLKSDKWIDFIQTTKNGTLTSLLMPLDRPMKTAKNIPIDDTLSWIVLEDAKEAPPFLGVKIPAQTLIDSQTNFATLNEELVTATWGFVALFNPFSLVELSLNTEKEASTLQNIINMPVFLKSVKQGIFYLKEGGKDLASWIQNDLKEKQKLLLPSSKASSCVAGDGHSSDEHMEELSERFDLTVMASLFSSLLTKGNFGDSLFSKAAPQGIARFDKKNAFGPILLSKEIFFEKPLFTDELYFKTHPPSEFCAGIASSLVVIAPSQRDRVFLANTFHLQDPTNPQIEGYLTIGIDENSLLHDLVLSTNLGAFLVHNNTVISGYTKQGVPLENPSKVVPFEPHMTKEASGTVTWQGKNYYYMNMTPFPELDLHFFLVDLESHAFTLLHSLTEGSRLLISSVSFDMRLIAIIALILVLALLHRFAKQVTEPIAKLAEATEKVAKGHLEAIQLPSVAPSHHDEVAILCTSFEQMVKGLREKEKVKGVLSKVVSPQIAEAILKTDVQLGGEERIVTVFFADIRSFTTMSSHLAPHEVVQLLNTCMTKVSHVIDEFGGVIDKYVGDEVMALFGAPLQQEDSALKAIECALEVIRTLKAWNEERKQKNLPPVEMGIGIHTGIMLVGNMGAENRLNYTVIGNNVNFAARLCATAKRMQILISKETKQSPHVEENILTEELKEIPLKGYEEKFTLYEVKGVVHA